MNRQGKISCTRDTTEGEGERDLRKKRDKIVVVNERRWEVCFQLLILIINNKKFVLTPFSVIIWWVFFSPSASSAGRDHPPVVADPLGERKREKTEISRKMMTCTEMGSQSVLLVQLQPLLLLLTATAVFLWNPPHSHFLPSGIYHNTTVFFLTILPFPLTVLSS